MGSISYPLQPWRRDSLVIAVETITLDGKRLPLTYSAMFLKDHKITSKQFSQIAWGNSMKDDLQMPTGKDLRRSVTTAHTYRQLRPSDLRRGDVPGKVFDQAAETLRQAAKDDLLVVTHNPDSDLRALIRGIEEPRVIDVPPLTVVSTGVLERARHLGLHPDPEESDFEFYRRIAEVEGELPDLLECFQERKWADGVMLPGDRMFPVFATALIFQSHTGGRLLRGR